MPPLNNFQRSCLTLAIGQALLTPSTQAATITVDTLLDDGTDGTYCTLREAVASVNNGVFTTDCPDPTMDGSGVPDTIEFDPSLIGELTLYGGMIELTSSVTINGPGADVLAISGNLSDGIFYAEADDISIRNLTLQNGSASFGGALYADQLISNLSIENCVLKNNSATFAGGALYFTNFVTDASIINSTFFGNSADDKGGAIHIRSANNLNISDSTFSYNSAGSKGGAVYLVNTHDGVTISNSTFERNQANKGAAIDIFSHPQSLNPPPNPSVSLVNSTLSANIAGNSGGGISAKGQYEIILTNSTLFGNQAIAGGGISAQSAANVVLEANNVIAASTGGDCDIPVTSGLSNWIEDASCTGTASGDPKLGLLADNGGPTLTHLPQEESGLIGAGNFAACAALPVNGLDQRGERRMAPCTIGAVEIASPTDFFVIPLPNGKVVVVPL